MKALPPEWEEPLEAEFTSHKTRVVGRWKKGETLEAIDQVIEEIPVAMVYNGISHAVMLATPTSLKAFGLGFSLSEGILRSVNEVYGMEAVPGPEGIELQMTIAQERFFDLKARRRNLTGRTGCGLCGTESLQQVRRQVGPVTSAQHFTPEAVHAALSSLPGRQTLQTLTGAVHAAAWCRADGGIAHVEEDIGRHNALDKLIGHVAMAGENFAQGFAIVTSRASYEMVQKAAMVAIPMLVAVSAPTGLAIELAEQAGVTLVGFARGSGHVVYAHSHRLSGSQAEK
jgi:FdhD protein